jgi:hypothetical protein
VALDISDQQTLYKYGLVRQDYGCFTTGMKVPWEAARRMALERPVVPDRGLGSPEILLRPPLVRLLYGFPAAARTHSLAATLL